MKAWKHFKTITYHHILVMMLCFHIGLYRQGLMHDLSKYSWTEFRVGAKYYTGTRSPNVGERNDIGYSTAWLHHKGRNKHHFEYWVDYLSGTRTYVPLEMPPRYFAEMCMDRIAACKVYHGKAYTDEDPLQYLLRAGDYNLMNENTRRQLQYVMEMLRDKGERETFAFIREVVLKGGKFALPKQ
ncbi:MAG: DUF5662 family protein [Oscillospiraceae bacterium]|nr:DUF5662 family protein [Oscillospiraceae bacterium]